MAVKQSLREVAYRHIQAKLLDPSASKMTFSDRILADEIGISRTPVREAIRQLEGDQLIKRRSRSGSSVNMPTQSEVEEAYDLRLMLETYAVSRATRFIRPSQLRKLDAQNRILLDIHKQCRSKVDNIVDQLDGDISRADMAFHMMILRFGECSHALRFVENLHLLTKLARPGNWGGQQVAPLRVAATAIREHHQIIRALRMQDAEAACAVIVRHIERGKIVRLESIAGQSPLGADAEDLVVDARRVLRHTKTHRAVVDSRDDGVGR